MVIGIIGKIMFVFDVWLFFWFGKFVCFKLEWCVGVWLYLFVSGRIVGGDFLF